MLSREEIVRGLAAVFETGRGQTSLSEYRTRLASRLGDILGRRAVVGVLDAYAESILASDSLGADFSLPFDHTTPLGDVLFIEPGHPIASLSSIALPSGLATSAVLGSRVGAFLGIDMKRDDVDKEALVALAYQTTLAMETILERAESFREAEVMASDARSKADLLATVSHEIRTPLNTIINLPEKLREYFVFDREHQTTEFSGNASVALRSLQMLERSGQHMLSLVNDILDAGRIDAGKVPLRPESSDASELLKQVALDCSPSADERQIEIRLEADAALGEILCDPIRVSQIVVNLVTNAIKYSSPGSRIQMFGRSRGKDEIEISVVDEGIGIGINDQEKIFERYVRLHATLPDDDRAGSGLGLHITKKLVELHDGSITVESELGRGSTFTVILPRQARSLQLLRNQNEPPVAVESDDDREHTILLIDDDATVLETAELLLEELGHALVSTTDASQLEELIRRHQPSLIVLDVTIGGVNGLDLLKELRKTHSAESLPVLVSSGHPLEALQLSHLGAGWLPKPWRRVDLLGAVSRQMRVE